MTTMQNRRANIRVTMTGAEFKAWRKLMGWSMRDAGDHLGINRNTVMDYDRNGTTEKIRLACDALAVKHGKVQIDLKFPYYGAK